MHTPLCKHAYGEPEEYAERALAIGLRGIIFTCHSPMPRGFWPQVRMAVEEFETYCALIQRAADAYRGRLEIRLGIESDYFPGFEDWITQLHQQAPFHYCLGSVHFQGKDYMDRFGHSDDLEFQRTYFQHLADSAETGLFDCLAHPDLVKNYKPYDWSLAAVLPAITTALDRIAKTGVAMELNTSGLLKRLPEMNPSADILALMQARGIPVVVGSDSHVARRVGENFRQALQTLQSVGYQHVSVFENRVRSELAITDVLASLRE
jgi:histidinol-phosphatase (PHP family)